MTQGTGAPATVPTRASVAGRQARLPACGGGSATSCMYTRAWPRSPQQRAHVLPPARGCSPRTPEGPFTHHVQCRLLSPVPRLKIALARGNPQTIAPSLGCIPQWRGLLVCVLRVFGFAFGLVRHLVSLSLRSVC